MTVRKILHHVMAVRGLGTGSEEENCNQLFALRMSELGQTLPSRDFCGTAALPLKPAIVWRGRHVRKVPSSGHSLLKRHVNFATPMTPVASSEPTLGQVGLKT